MSKTDFENFPIGTTFNGVNLQAKPELIADSISVDYPSRLEAMALDPGKIADNNNLVYEAGQIDFSVGIYKHIAVSTEGEPGTINITDGTPRQSLVRHAAMIMMEGLGVNDGLKIDVQDAVDLRHCGLGSSSSLIAGTAAAINELYGLPVAALDLVRYCAQNHGEEIDNNPEKLVPVQCIGGSAVCGHFKGGLIVLSGQATPVFTADIPEDKEFIIGVPEDFTHPDSQQLMNAEIDNIEVFRSTGEVYGKEIAYRILHEVLPSLVGGDFKKCKDLIFDYRWDMGSIRNCSFVYPRMNEIAEALRWMKDEPDIDIVSLSSVGPGFFCLTSNAEVVEDAFQSLSLKTHRAHAHNGRYTVTMNGSL